MSEQVKLGIIGVGQIGKSHLKQYLQVPEARIVAACDVNEQELARVAKEYNIPNTFTDYRKLLAMDEIVAVDVCLVNLYLHQPGEPATLPRLRVGEWRSGNVAGGHRAPFRTNLRPHRACDVLQ
jgi:hypothetical protein